MKLILSRKGFDSSAGGVASPIFPDGTMVSLPIPDSEAPVRYNRIRGEKPGFGTLVNQLSHNVSATDAAHLDPDLNPNHQARHPDWLPAFGQTGAALGHLRANDVGVGDLFLFFGWFRSVERFQRRWRYCPRSPDQHVLFGWLQIGKIVDLNDEPPGLPWREHVHCKRSFRGANALFIARPNLILNGVELGLPGGGTWPALQPERVLTAPGCTRSHWKLPRSFAPFTRDGVLDCLSCHTRPERWQTGRNHCKLHIAPRGQEFVLDCAHRPGVRRWLTSLFDLA